MYSTSRKRFSQMQRSICIWTRPDVACTQMQTHTNAHECMQTQMHARGYGHKSTQVGPHECMQIHADANAHDTKWMLLDELRENCVQCVGGHNFKTRLDIRSLFKDFRDVLSSDSQPYLIIHTHLLVLSALCSIGGIERSIISAEMFMSFGSSVRAP